MKVWRSPELICFLAALLFRLAWLMTVLARGGAAQLPDECVHWSIAANLMQHGVFVSEEGRYAARMPLYPLFLACFVNLGEPSEFAAKVAQSVIGAVTVVLAIRIARRIGGTPTAWAAGGLAAADPYAIYFSNLLLTETVFTPALVVLTLIMLRLLGVTPRSADGRVGTPDSRLSPTADRDSDWPAVLGLALAGAGAVLIRPSAAGLVVLFWAAACVLPPTWKQRLLRAAVFAAIFAAAMLPWGLRNKGVIGDYAWLSTNGGLTLYDGQGPQAAGGSDQAFAYIMPELWPLSEVEQDRRLRTLAIEQMQRDPQRVLELAAIKFLRTWSLTPNATEFSSGLRDAVSAVFSGGVFVLALVGAWRLRRHYSLLIFLLAPIVYFTLVHCIYVGSLRYRIPLMPLVEILAAAGLFLRYTHQFQRSG